MREPYAPLREWIDSRKAEGKTIADMARGMGLPFNTLGDMYRGTSNPLNATRATKEKLYAGTGIEAFKADNQTEAPISKIELAKGSLSYDIHDFEKSLDALSQVGETAYAAMVRKLPHDLQVAIAKAKGYPTAERRTENIVDLFYLIIDEIEFLKESPEGRKMLTEALPQDHVDYVSSLLRAIYKDDQFKMWMFSNTTKPRRRR